MIARKINKGIACHPFLPNFFFLWSRRKQIPVVAPQAMSNSAFPLGSLWWTRLYTTSLDCLSYPFSLKLVSDDSDRMYVVWSVSSVLTQSLAPARASPIRAALGKPCNIILQHQHLSLTFRPSTRCTLYNQYGGLSQVWNWIIQEMQVTLVHNYTRNKHILQTSDFTPPNKFSIAGFGITYNAWLWKTSSTGGERASDFTDPASKGPERRRATEIAFGQFTTSSLLHPVSLSVLDTSCSLCKLPPWWWWPLLQSEPSASLPTPTTSDPSSCIEGPTFASAWP